MIIIQELISISCLCMGFFIGFKLGMLFKNKEKNEQEKPQSPPIFKKEKQQKMTKEEKKKYDEEMERFKQIWDNISIYDGSAQNQKKVG